MAVVGDEKATGTRTGVAALLVRADLFTASVVQLTLICLLTGPAIAKQGVTLATGTAVAVVCVHTEVLALVRVQLALVYV